MLVGGAITILKNDGVRQWEGWHPIYEIENKNMFETTNQYDLERIETLRHESIQIHQQTRSSARKEVNKSDLKTKTKDCTVARKHDDDNDVDW